MHVRANTLAIGTRAFWDGFICGCAAVAIAFAAFMTALTATGY